MRSEKYIHLLLTHANLADIQLISRFNKGIRFLLFVINNFSEYATVFPLKDKKRIAITNVFQKKLYDSSRYTGQIWKEVNFTNNQ